MSTFLEIALSNAAVATVVALAVALLTRFVRRPQLAHALWLLVLLKFVTPPLWGLPWLPISVSESPAPPAIFPTGNLPITQEFAKNPASDFPTVDPSRLAADSVVPQPVSDETQSSFSRAPTLAELTTLIWLAGSLTWVAICTVRIAKFNRLVRALPPADERWQHELAALAERLGMRSCPEVKLADATIPPLLWVLGRQRAIVLPASLVAELAPAGQRALLAHELAHYARRDYLIRGLEMLVLALYWWHPVAWWARRRVQLAEEQCCDALAIQLLDGATHNYGQTLLATLDFLSERHSRTPLVASAMGRFIDTQRRFAMIIAGADAKRLSSGTWGLLAAIALVVLPVSLRKSAAETLQQPDWARLSPFTAVDVAGDKAQVEVDGARYELVSIDGLTTAELLAAARKHYGPLWEKRFVEDIVEVMEHAGRRPGETVKLVLRDRQTGAEKTIDNAPVTAENRQKVYRARSGIAQAGGEPAVEWARLSPFSAVDISGNQVEVEVDGDRFELLSIDGLTTAQLLAAARKHYGDLWQKRFVEDIVEVMEKSDKRPGKTVSLVLRDRTSGAERTIEKAPLTFENRLGTYLHRQQMLERLAAAHSRSLAGLSPQDEKEIRALIARFVKAAAQNDRGEFAKTLSRHASENGARDDHYFDDTQKILKVAQRLAELRSLLPLPDGNVLAVTDFFDAQDHKHPGMICIVYCCTKVNGEWLIHDIDAQDVNGLVGEVGRRSARAARPEAEGSPELPKD